GFPSLAVDGQDVLAVYRASKEAVARARRGDGPTLLEFQTYRYVAQNAYESDDRPREELAAWLKRDPIPSFRSWLAESGGFEEREIQEIEAECKRSLDEAFAFADASPYPKEREI